MKMMSNMFFVSSSQIALEIPAVFSRFHIGGRSTGICPFANRQNFTRIERLIRFSIFFKSGVKPGTNAPGDPQIFSTIGAVGQEGVTPPGPEKYGVFAAR